GGGDVESGLWRVDRSARRGVDRLARQFERSAKRVEAREVEGADRETTLLKALLVGFPDRVARRRSRGSERARMVGGRGLRQLPSSRVTEGEFFLALRVDESVRGERLEGRVTLASHVTRAWIESAFPQDVEERTEHRFDAEKEKVRAFRCVRYRDLPLEDEREVRADPEEATEILKRELATRAVDILESDPDSSAWFARYRWVKENCETLDLPSWNANDLAEILAQHCRGGTDFKLLRQPNAAANALLGALTYEQSQAIERNAPAEIDVPSGRSIPLKYEGNGPPVLAVKLQEMFGLADTPRIGGGTHPVLLHLLAPNRRPVQVTQDLKSFWDTTYAQVRKDLRGRYPKHPWPEDPWSAAPTKGTKKRPR
ncbi:MAG: ATP-dependent helicase C-terminal domain-containing protein, partial [Planctomycetota bacterium]